MTCSWEKTNSPSLPPARVWSYTAPESERISRPSYTTTLRGGTRQHQNHLNAAFSMCFYYRWGTPWKKNQHIFKSDLKQTNNVFTFTWTFDTWPHFFIRYFQTFPQVLFVRMTHFYQRCIQTSLLLFSFLPHDTSEGYTDILTHLMAIITLHLGHSHPSAT